MLDPERCWQAVLARDTSQDGLFVYAVVSTKIYCRPGCPARRPDRERVRFFAGPTEAEAAGFRACRRCRPTEVPATWVAELCRTLEANPDRPLSLAELGKQAKLSPSHLQRAFTRAVGVSPRRYQQALRLGEFKHHLKETASVSTAIYAAGYGSPSRLYEQNLGMTPATYGRGGRGATIRYAFASTILGQLVAAATERGVCFVGIGDAPDALVAELKGEFPEATVIPDDTGLGGWLQAVIALLDGESPGSDLPLDIRATAFQCRVWEELQAIPAGHTLSYGEIARRLGNPKAVRAVGRACATNPVAIVIPCHRAVREDGGLAGYRWGIERKRTLIECERSRAGESLVDTP